MTLKDRLEIQRNCKNESMKEKFLEREVKKLKEDLKEQRNMD